ncbi:MAG TPA: hypothetical protein VNJ12_07695 [Candidatus Dormibacteraeota bacterium]|nr:hypothetical protein [Candidatus Dormibacteraeota bacterium]
MAANRSQGRYYTLFLVASIVLCAGLYDYSGGMGKLLLIVGAVGLVASLLGMMRIKPLEGRTALKPGPGFMKLVGAGVCALGWVITLFGLHMTSSMGGRLVLALVGISVSLFGIVVVLPAAFNKNAVWKA